MEISKIEMRKQYDTYCILAHFINGNLQTFYEKNKAMALALVEQLESTYNTDGKRAERFIAEN